MHYLREVQDNISPSGSVREEVGIRLWYKGTFVPRSAGSKMSERVAAPIAMTELLPAA